MQQRGTCTSNPLAFPTDRGTGTNVPTQNRGTVGNSRRTEEAHTHHHGQDHTPPTDGGTTRCGNPRSERNGRAIGNRTTAPSYTTGTGCRHHTDQCSATRTHASATTRTNTRSPGTCHTTDLLTWDGAAQTPYPLSNPAKRTTADSLPPQNRSNQRERHRRDSHPRRTRLRSTPTLLQSSSKRIQCLPPS